LSAFHERGFFDVKVERDAMGADEYHPISHKGSNLTKAGGIGYTVVDALDTMLLMGLDAEYQRARSWIKSEMSFERDANFSTFEVRLWLIRAASMRSSL
jgi:endoplasmic reticulum Man9GlcNAc2 1,2-alpha-mannosidase